MITKSRGKECNHMFAHMMGIVKTSKANKIQLKYLSQQLKYQYKTILKLPLDISQNNSMYLLTIF